MHYHCCPTACLGAVIDQSTDPYTSSQLASLPLPWPSSSIGRLQWALWNVSPTLFTSSHLVFTSSLFLPGQSHTPSSWQIRSTCRRQLQSTQCSSSQDYLQLLKSSSFCHFSPPALLLSIYRRNHLWEDKAWQCSELGKQMGAFQQREIFLSSSSSSPCQGLVSCLHPSSWPSASCNAQTAPLHRAEPLCVATFSLADSKSSKHKAGIVLPGSILCLSGHTRAVDLLLVRQLLHLITALVSLQHGPRSWVGTVSVSIS